MSTHTLCKQFESMGARLKVLPIDRADWRWRYRRLPAGYTLDIQTDRRGEYFVIYHYEGQAPDIGVLQARPGERHLLLYADDGNRFLCGHDERHWFVAGIRDRVSTVRDAKRSLMPEPVRDHAHGVSPRRLDNRRNEVFIRQGEWFFVPADIDVLDDQIIRNERLQRVAFSKPHICQELFRQGGQTVFLVRSQVLSPDEYAALVKRAPEWGGMQPRIRNPEVYVRGKVRHPDHATVRLDGWHRVYINGELYGPDVSFLD